MVGSSSLSENSSIIHLCLLFLLHRYIQNPRPITKQMNPIPPKKMPTSAARSMFERVGVVKLVGLFELVELVKVWLGDEMVGKVEADVCDFLRVNSLTHLKLL